MEIDCKIQLNHANKVYYAGQRLSGHVELLLNEPLSVRGKYSLCSNSTSNEIVFNIFPVFSPRQSNLRGNQWSCLLPLVPEQSQRVRWP